MNGLTLLALIVLAIGAFVAYRTGLMHGRRDALASLPLRAAVNNVSSQTASAESAPRETIAETIEVERIDADRVVAQSDIPAHDNATGIEKARLVRSLLAETNALRRAATTGEAQRLQLADFALDRRRLLREAAQARADTARYRELVIDLENNALPPLLTGPNAFDDLKLIVGIGPVLERMLQRLGISTYRQIARWSERDVDEFDAKLPEFPGRIRRDGWVAQARALHQSKYGETLPVR